MTTARSRRPRPGPRATPRVGSFAPIPPVPVPRPSGGTQDALFGPPQVVPATGERYGDPDNSSADLDLIAAVIRHAAEPGYVLVGPSDRVHTRHDTHRDVAESVPRYEADTVGELLDSGHLRIGGECRVSTGDHLRSARSVLVTSRARATLARWTTKHVTS